MAALAAAGAVFVDAGAARTAAAPTRRDRSSSGMYSAHDFGVPTSPNGGSRNGKTSIRAAAKRRRVKAHRARGRG